MNPFTALLVEGTSGIGKSTLIDALIRRHVSSSEPRKIRTLVHLAQSHTYGPLARREDEGTLTVDENLRHLERVAGTMEWLHAGVHEHTRPWCFALIDTLHLTHCVRPGVVKWSDVEPFDRRMATLGCKLVFLQAAPALIWERGIKSRTQQQFIQVYARKFGRTHEEIHQHFVREQEILIRLFSHSVMPKAVASHGRVRGRGRGKPVLDGRLHGTESWATMTGDELMNRFERGAIPDDPFHHVDHVRLAFAYLRRYPALQALEKFTAALKRFAAARGKPQLYNETITHAYFFLIRERMARADGVNWEEFALRNPDLLIWKDGILSRYYHDATLRSDLARNVFVFPDRCC